MKKQVSILVAFKEGCYRVCLEIALSDIMHIPDVSIVSDGIAAISFAYNRNSDVIFLDSQIPKINSSEVINILVKNCPQIRIIVISDTLNVFEVLDAFSKGVYSYLLRKNAIQQIKTCFEFVSNFEKFYPNEVSQELFNKFFHKSAPEKKINSYEKYSSSELEVINYLNKGLTAKEIAFKVMLSNRTVEGIKSRLFIKTGTSNTIELLNFLKAGYRE